MFDYAGAIHFHSHYSYDAYVPLSQIIDDALGAHLDFGILTDHFKLDAKRDGWERYHGGVGGSGDRGIGEKTVSDPPALRSPDPKPFLLIVGEEVSPRYNHYLAFDLKEPVISSKTHPEPQRIIDAVAAQGGFGFIAHPDHGGAPLMGVRAYPWIDWSVTGYAGMSIWDLIGDWVGTLRSYPSLLRSSIMPMRVLRGPHPQTLQRWDALNARGRCMAIGEIDNHGTKKKFLGIEKTIFSFPLAFRTIRTHVMLAQTLSGDSTVDRQTILAALRAGSSYVSMDYWQDPKGFQFEILDSQKRVGMGETFRREGAALIEAKVPGSGRVRLIRNGVTIWEERRHHHIERDLELPGVYRIEVDHYVAGRWRPWIFSNPIWVE